MKILFTADWHIKVGQKNVPETWACERYSRFFKEVHKLEKDVDLHVIGVGTHSQWIKIYPNL